MLRLLFVTVTALVAFGIATPQVIYLPTVIGVGATSTALVPVETQVPTAPETPTPTQTATPAITPTVAATSVPRITVLDNHSTFLYSDYLDLVGEIQNDTGGLAVNMHVVVHLFDQQDQLIERVSTLIEVPLLVAGDRTCFYVGFTGQPTWSYYTFETSYQDNADGTYDIEMYSLSLTSHEGTIEDNSTKTYTIDGQIHNDGNETVPYPRVLGTLYNAEGKVIGCTGEGADESPLEPDQVSPWNLSFWHDKATETSTYRIQPYWQPDW